jgi:hypothetical protein
MSARTLNEAKLIIYRRISNYYGSWASTNGLDRDTERCAVSEYQQFMLLQWVMSLTNCNVEKHYIPPSAGAKRIWQEHMFDSKNYRIFCSELTGVFIDNDPFEIIQVGVYEKGILFASCLQKHCCKGVSFSNFYLQEVLPLKKTA